MHIICQITFWALIKRFPVFVMFDITGKMSQNLFFLGKSAFFLENLCFQQHSGPKDMILLIPH